MTVVVENSADQVEAYTTGKGVFPIPADVAADNAKQEAKANGEKTDNGSADSKSSAKEAGDAKSDTAAAVAGTEETKQDAGSDDIEGEDGLTPRQKRDFTKAMQATIGKKHRMQREAEEYASTLYNNSKLAEERAAKLEADLAALKAQLQPPKAESVEEPKREAFKTDQEYWDAMVDHRVDKKLRAEATARQQREQEQFIQEETQHAQAKMDRAFEVGPEDFKEVYEGADMVLPNYVLESIKSSDLMPELVYHLGNNPKEAERIKAMTDGCPPGSARFARAAQRQLVEIGKIESTLNHSPRKLRRKSSQKTARGESEDDRKGRARNGISPE